MASPMRIFGGAAAFALLAAIRPALVAGQVSLSLCASFNTAETERNISIYQTNGLCKDFCMEDYAYAITQDNACWCSNYTPDDSVQEDLDECDTNCPAYPDEYCGGRGLYGYVVLNGHLPSGTQGGESSAPETTTRSDSSTTEAPESTPSVETVTNDGSVITVTVAEPTETDPDAGNAAEESGSTSSGGGSSGLSSGGIAGVVVGAIGGVAIVAGFVLFWFMKRKKKNRQEEYQVDPSVSDRGGSSGHMGPEMAAAGGSQASPPNNSNRNSTLQIDPRMDPFQQGLYARTGSHESINTLRDEHDYSRRIQQPKVLRAMNPDPEN